MKNVHELKISGTYREDRHGDRAEGMKPSCAPQPPAHLTAAEKKIFREVAETMFESSFITDLDVNVLELYAVQMALFRKAKKQLQKGKEYTTEYINKSGAKNEVPSAWLKIMNDSTDQLLKLQAKLGLTPTDRKKVSLATKGEEDDDSLLKDPTRKMKLFK